MTDAVLEDGFRLGLVEESLHAAAVAVAAVVAAAAAAVAAARVMGSTRLAGFEKRVVTGLSADRRTSRCLVESKTSCRLDLRNASNNGWVNLSLAQ